MQWMILEGSPQSVDRVKGSRCHVIECAPVIRDEVSGLESLEEGKRVTAGKMTLTESGFPPGRVADWQERKIEIASRCLQMFLDQVRRVRGKRGVAGEEAGHLVSINKVHICRVPPAIDAVAAPFVRRSGGPYFHAIEFDSSIRGDRNRMTVALLP